MILTSFIFGSILAVASLLLSNEPADAHVLRTDGSIGAVIHIDPEDDPIVGQPATFFFDIVDKQNRFRPNDCDCQVTIDQHAKTIFQAPLTRTNSTNTNFTYTLPERGIYNVRLTGRPLGNHAFQPFMLIYDIRVERTAAQTSQVSGRWMPIGIVVGTVIILGLSLSINKSK